MAQPPARAGLMTISQLLGGFSRSKIRTYNTCAGTSYMRKAIGQTTLNYGTTAGESGPYDDLTASWRILALENPHIQYLRWHLLHAQGNRPDDIELWHNRRRERAL